MARDNTKKSDIEQSVDQYMAYLNGDASNVSVSTIVLTLRRSIQQPKSSRFDRK